MTAARRRAPAVQLHLDCVFERAARHQFGADQPLPPSPMPDGAAGDLMRPGGPLAARLLVKALASTTPARCEDSATKQAEEAAAHQASIGGDAPARLDT
jgi:hypothetical protein